MLKLVVPYEGEVLGRAGVLLQNIIQSLDFVSNLVKLMLAVVAV